MKNSNTTSMQKALVLAATLALASASAWAEEAHHPEGAASAVKAPAAKTPTIQAPPTKTMSPDAAQGMGMMPAK